VCICFLYAVSGVEGSVSKISLDAESGRKINLPLDGKKHEISLVRSFRYFSFPF